jgi:hypothetical protein
VDRCQQWTEATRKAEGGIDFREDFRAGVGSLARLSSRDREPRCLRP